MLNKDRRTKLKISEVFTNNDNDIKLCHNGIHMNSNTTIDILKIVKPTVRMVSILFVLMAIPIEGNSVCHNN